MIKNYIITAIRNLLKHKLHSFINIFGLAIGFAVAMLIAFFVRTELSFEQGFTKADQIYRLTWESKTTGNRFGTVDNPAGPAMAKDFPEVLDANRLATSEMLLSVDDRQAFETVYFSENNFFALFDLQFIEGSPANALADPNSIVLTQSAAEKYFGDESAMGRSLTLGGSQDMVVTAVIADMPATTQFTMNFLAPMETAAALFGGEFLERWGSDVLHAYLLLAPGTDPVALEAKFPDFIDRYMDGRSEFISYRLQALGDIHFTPNLENELPERDGITGAVKSFREKSNIYILAIAALFVLVVASINFINLQVAQASHRMKEVAVRKVNGATRNDIALQFIGESLFLALFGFAAALILTEIAAPWFGDLSGVRFSLFQHTGGLFLPAFVGVALLVGLISGLYPSLLLAGLLPAKIFKGEFFSTGSGAHLRTGLVVIQFAIAIGLIIATTVIRSQVEYSMEKPLGYDRSEIITIPMDRRIIRENYVTLKTGFLTYPDVVSVTSSSIAPTRDLSDGWSFTEPGGSEEETLSVRAAFVNFDFFETYGIEMAAGRAFSEAFGNDRAPFPDAENPHIETTVILNETALRTWGWGNPQDALGRTLLTNYTDDGVELSMAFTVVGIARDVHFRSLRNEIVPMAYMNAPGGAMISIKTSGDNMAGVLDHIGGVWSSVIADYPLRTTFIADDYQALYADEQRSLELSSVVSLLAIIISCLGLYSIAAFIAEKRTKEIGIRKVHGASVPALVRAVSLHFLKPVLLANLIAWPLAFYFMDQWLTGFAYRIDLGLSPFLIAGVGAALIALATVLAHAIRVARSNPVHALRYE